MSFAPAFFVFWGGLRLSRPDLLLSQDLDRRFETGLAPGSRAYGLARRYPIVESVSALL
jgi:hypothetical protein